MHVALVGSHFIGWVKNFPTDRTGRGVGQVDIFNVVGEVGDALAAVGTNPRAVSQAAWNDSCQDIRWASAAEDNKWKLFALAQIIFIVCGSNFCVSSFCSERRKSCRIQCRELDLVNVCPPHGNSTSESACDKRDNSQARFWIFLPLNLKLECDLLDSEMVSHGLWQFLT